MTSLASIVWNVDPVLLHLGPLEIRWYGLMWGIGFILAYEMVSRLFRKENYPEANAHTHYGNSRNHTVEQPPYVLTCYFLAIPYKRKYQAEYSAVTGQTTLPYLQYFYRMRSVIIPFIK